MFLLSFSILHDINLSRARNTKFIRSQTKEMVVCNLLYKIIGSDDQLHTVGEISGTHFKCVDFLIMLIRVI